jgi:antitoxin Phd
MKVYTYSEARQRLADLLDEAQQEGTVRIRRKDGRVFVLQPAEVEDSPLDIQGIPLDITTNEIIDIIREGRERD